MNDLILIKHIIINKSIYNNIYKYINKDYIKTIHKELYKLLLVIEEWYSDESHTAFLSIQDFQAVFFNSYPALKKADMELFLSIFKQLSEIDVSEEILSSVLEAHKKRAVASELATLAWDVAEGRREFQELSRALEQASLDIEKPTETKVEFITDNLEELYETTYGTPGIPWRLKTLRRMMGSLRKGDFGFLFARPEVGKTTFLVDNGSHFARQGNVVLHFNNEEDGKKIKIRYYQATLGLSSRELFDNFSKNTRQFLEVTGGRIKIVPHEFSRDKRDIERIIQETNPGIIIIDSIDKVSGFAEDRDDLMYKAIYSWARTLALQYAPIIGVCHASATGEGKKYLEMDDVAYAKTSKQAEADWILGIGKSHNPADGEFTRFFSLPKNKLMGDDEMQEEYRHGQLPVRIYPEIAQYDDVIGWE